MKSEFCSLEEYELREIEGGSFIGAIVGTAIYLSVDAVVKGRTGQSIAAHAWDAWEAYNRWHPLGDPKHKR